MFSPVALWLARRPGWRISGFAEFPALRPGATDAERDDFLIVGGLALVLSRCPRQAAPRRFPAAIQVYAALKRGVDRRSALTPELISDASHDVAAFADAATRAAMRRRLRSLMSRAGASRPARDPVIALSPPDGIVRRIEAEG